MTTFENKKNTTLLLYFEKKSTRTQKCAHKDIKSGADLSIDLQDDSGTQVVEHKRLMRLSNAQLPRQSGVLDARPTAGTCSTIVARDGDVLCFALEPTKLDPRVPKLLYSDELPWQRQWQRHRHPLRRRA